MYKDTYKEMYKDTYKDMYKDTYKEMYKDTYKDTYKDLREDEENFQEERLHGIKTAMRVWVRVSVCVRKCVCKGGRGRRSSESMCVLVCIDIDRLHTNTLST